MATTGKPEKKQNHTITEKVIDLKLHLPQQVVPDSFIEFLEGVTAAFANGEYVGGAIVLVERGGKAVCTKHISGYAGATLLGLGMVHNQIIKEVTEYEPD